MFSSVQRSLNPFWSRQGESRLRRFSGSQAQAPYEGAGNITEWSKNVSKGEAGTVTTTNTIRRTPGRLGDHVILPLVMAILRWSDSDIIAV